MKVLHIVASLALAVAGSAAIAQNAARKPYIVELTEAPALAYEGQVPGLAATRPAAGQRLQVSADAVQNYISYLETQQTNVMAAVPGIQANYRYKLAFNGFAAFLTDAEVAKLAATPGVRKIMADEPMQLDTSTTPRFLGLSTPGGVWQMTDSNGNRIKGENVIIGHMDGGVWPEDPSFSDKVDANGNPIPSHLAGTVVYSAPPARWSGICQPSTGSSGVSFTAAHCNNKLIGARFYNATWKQAEALGLVRTWSQEYLDSPRDPDGHGTHTLSTSGGNENVKVTIAGSPFTISGIAPRARVAAYKVCYTPADANDNPQLGSCYPSDSVAAIDQAVEDGVDVMNFSVGGSRTSFSDGVETAFARAAILNDIFVATAAGNANVNGASTVAHISPWLMTVGNSSHDRFTAATVTLGTGQTAFGASFQTTGVASKPLVLSYEAGINPYAGLSNADKLALARCYNAGDRAALGGSAAAALDPAKVAGKIVVCIRGGNALVNKAQEVADAGGAAVIIQNIPAGLLAAPLNAASADSSLALPFAVPGVHLQASSAAAVIGHATGGAGTASIAPSVQVSGVAAPVMNATSSRGPNLRDLNVLKPDITAPGTDIMAAYTNTSISPAQRDQIIAGTLVPEPGADMISGTSMASPHVAGAGALLRQAHPDWSPFAIKSVLMTSAQQNVVLASGAPDTNRWGYGAGHLNPGGALNTNVVYDQSPVDHINYYVGNINGRALNLASLTHANVVGIGSLTRTLTNKGATSVTLTGTASLAGFQVTLSPTSLTIPPGGSASFTTTLRRTTAPIEQWVFGNVVWTNGSQTLQSPLTAKASELVALSSLADTRTVGTKVITIATGYDGNFFTTGFGLTPAAVNTGRIALNEQQCFPITVAAGTKILRAQLFDSDTEGGNQSDLDLDLYRGTTLVASSGSATSEELVQLSNPTAGNYQACVFGFAPVNGSAAYKLSSWVLGPSNPGTLRAFGPSRVALGGVASVGISWNVAANARYLGSVEYRSVSTAAPIGTTTVLIDTVPGSTTTPTSAPVTKAKPER